MKIFGETPPRRGGTTSGKKEKALGGKDIDGKERTHCKGKRGLSAEL